VIAYMMEKREKTLGKIFQMLKFSSIEPDTFHNRLIYQKIIYLLQFSGVSLGFRFNWYIRGPYSSDLANAIYNIQADRTLFFESARIKFKNQEQVEQKIDKFLTILGENIENPEFLEILASIAYIKENDPAYRNVDENLKKRLLRLKPFIKDFSNFDELYNKSEKSLRIMSRKHAA
jgi:uncharacterized protein YwgA